MLIKTLETPPSNLIDSGNLQINITDENNRPIPDASINISFTGNPNTTIENLNTNSSGQTPNVSLSAPPVELSLDSNNIIQPYSEYTAFITANGYEPLDISGIEILRNRIPLDWTSSVKKERQA